MRRLALHLIAGPLAAACAYALVMLASAAIAFLLGLPILDALQAGQWTGAVIAVAIGLLFTANYMRPGP